MNKTDPAFMITVATSEMSTPTISRLTSFRFTDFEGRMQVSASLDFKRKSSNCWSVDLLTQSKIFKPFYISVGTILKCEYMKYINAGGGIAKTVLMC